MIVSSVGQSSKSSSGQETSLSASGPVPPPSKWIATEVDVKTVKELENKFRIFEPLLKARSTRRMLLGVLSESSGSILTQSSDLSSKDLGAASTAFARVSNHLDDVLQSTESIPSDHLKFSRYLEKLQAIPIHSFDSSELKNNSSSSYEWNLIYNAANASLNVYEEPTEIKKDIGHGKIIESRGRTKAIIAYIDQIQNEKVLIIAVRGTATRDDWMLNVNSAPKKSSKLLPKSALWHGGFLAVAMAMEKKVADVIRDFGEQGDDFNSVIFTGHSAGGAIAQIFYAMSLTEGTKLSEAVSGALNTNCITFGTPPISSIPLHTGLDPGRRSGSFLHVVNEGDPVPLAQDEFIKTLIEVYVLGPKDLAERYPEGMKVPQGQLKVSGNLIVFRDVDPDDGNANDIEAFTADRNVLETKLFGNPFVHFMREYMDRIEKVTSDKTFE